MTMLTILLVVAAAFLGALAIPFLFGAAEALNAHRDKTVLGISRTLLSFAFWGVWLAASFAYAVFSAFFFLVWGGDPYMLLGLLGAVISAIGALVMLRRVRDAQMR